MHNCKAVVVHCIDFRFRKTLNEFLDRLFPEGYDLVSVAGGVKDIDFVLQQVRISNKLHQPDLIVLIQHEDCGAYGTSRAFKDFSEEQSFQKSELQKAESLFKKEFPQPIEKYFACLSGVIEKIA